MLPNATWLNLNTIPTTHSKGLKGLEHIVNSKHVNTVGYVQCMHIRIAMYILATCNSTIVT